MSSSFSSSVNNNDDSSIIKTETTIISAPPTTTSLSSRIISGSIGSIVTALTITPLEVVKVRQQISSPPPATVVATTAAAARPSILPCPSCGTSVYLNNGLMECLVSRHTIFPSSAVSTTTTIASAAPSSSARPTMQVATTAAGGGGTFATLRQIFLTEGFVGIYAGLAPTLVMSIPNTVLYFTTYDELSSRLSKKTSPKSKWTIPLIAGSTARLLASGITAPFELIRTRRAMMTMSTNAANTNNNMWTEMYQILQKEGGIPALYKGLAPTLWRDVPFSAIYWYHLEYFQKTLWTDTTNTNNTTNTFQKAYQSFVNGALAGIIAAACTTPFDVVKTRRQQQQQQQVVVANTASTTKGSSSLSSCEHFGAKEVVLRQQQPPPKSSLLPNSSTNTTTFGTLRFIFQTEGISGLWRGNTTRILKIAPACAIMISCYEVGKLVLK